MCYLFQSQRARRNAGSLSRVTQVTRVTHIIICFYVSFVFLSSSLAPSHFSSIGYFFLQKVCYPCYLRIRTPFFVLPFVLPCVTFCVTFSSGLLLVGVLTPFFVCYLSKIVCYLFVLPFSDSRVTFSGHSKQKKQLRRATFFC